MSHVYVASIRPYPSFALPEGATDAEEYTAHALKALEARFPSKLLRLWDPIAFAGSFDEAELGVAINKEIFERSRTSLKDDLGVPLEQLAGVVVVPGDGWAPGGGGYHESDVTAQALVKVDTETSIRNWSITVTPDLQPSAQVEIAFEVSWLKVPVIS